MLIGSHGVKLNHGMGMQMDNQPDPQPKDQDLETSVSIGVTIPNYDAMRYVHPYSARLWVLGSISKRTRDVDAGLPYSGLHNTVDKLWPGIDYTSGNQPPTAVCNR